MDLETYEQFHVPRDISEATRFLKEGMTVQGAMYNGRPLDITPPASVELKITDTPPGVRGDTVSGGTKPATLETGAVVQVPLFVNPGETVRVDTRTGEYLGRA
jgi:elongation factor P